MTSIINFFLRNTVAANLLMVFIFIFGFFGLMRIHTTFFPEVPSRIITIQLIYPGASPEEIEEGVVSKVEQNLVGVTGIEQTTSISSENAGAITVEAERGFDIDLVLQDVKNAVDRINSFPRDLEPPIIFKGEQIGESYVFSIGGDIELKALKQYSQIIEDELLLIDGISKVSIEGFPEEEIEISFREADMRAMNITFDEAVNAVAQTNLLSTGGTIKTKKEDLLIRAKNKNYYSTSFGDIVVKSSTDGGLVKLYQIADIIDKWEDSPTRSYVNGKPAVVMTVFNTLDEDMFSNSDNTKAYLKTFREKNPNLEVKEIVNGKKYLNGRIDFIKKNGLIGFLLVLVLLALFLNIRLAFWVALAIPISFAGMFIAASMLGITINVISTFGMIVVIGILVDDGIVIAENIYQAYESNIHQLNKLKTAVADNDFSSIDSDEQFSHFQELTQSLKAESWDETQIEKAFEEEAKAIPFRSALDGTMEVLPAVSSAIMTTVIAFSSFFFISGRLGDIFPQLSIVVIFTLVFSLIEGALILPAYIAHSKALSIGELNPITKAFDSMMNFMKTKLYGPVLKLSMNFPFPTLAICVAGLLGVFGAFSGGIIKSTFFPIVQRDSFTVTLEMPAGTNEARVYEILDSIERASWDINEEFKEKYFNNEKDVIDKIKKNVGPSSYQGSLTYYLLEGELRDSIKNRNVTSAIRKRIGTFHDADKLSFSLGNIFGDPVSISLLSTNKDELDAAVKELKNELKSIADLTDIQDGNKMGLKEVSLTLKPKAYNLGFTIGEIMRSVRQGFFGAEIQRLQRGEDEVKVWVRYDLQDRSSIADLANMQIRTATGQTIPLGELVNFDTERGIVAINHIDGRREIRVSADVANSKVSVSDVNADIETIILPKVLKNYPAVSIGFEGQAKQNAESQESIASVMPIIFIMMFFVVVLTFSSVSQALIVFFLIPFGFIGVGFGHWFMDKPFSFLSFLGVIALIGIFINDALVFISAFNDKIKKGDSFKNALYETGMSRFRPIVLTTVTTVAGLLPLLLEKSVQAQFLIPMAISVAFGLMIGTFILLVFIPALLAIANGMRLISTNLWTGVKHEAAEVEPAFAGRQHPWVLTLFMSVATFLLIAALVKASLKISEILL